MNIRHLVALATALTAASLVACNGSSQVTSAAPQPKGTLQAGSIVVTPSTIAAPDSGTVTATVADTVTSYTGQYAVSTGTSTILPACIQFTTGPASAPNSITVTTGTAIAVPSGSPTEAPCTTGTGTFIVTDSLGNSGSFTVTTP